MTKKQVIKALASAYAIDRKQNVSREMKSFSITTIRLIAIDLQIDWWDVIKETGIGSRPKQ